MGADQIRALRPRNADDVAAMAIAAQANVVQLRTAQSKRREDDAGPHGIRTPSPGPVKRFRETLIDWKLIRQYSDEEVALRLHETWGRFCLFCWAFQHGNPQEPPPFAAYAERRVLRSTMEIHAKTREIERGLWRLRHEQRLRTDPDAMKDKQFSRHAALALDLPVMVYGRNVRVAPADDVLRCACEYAGMLAAVRWIGDDRWSWGRDGIMDVNEPE